MTTALPLLAALLLAYLLGSIPTGLLLTRAFTDIDLRQVGSGNIGATNVLRTGRKGLAAATLLGDAVKGIVAVVLARSLFELPLAEGAAWAATAAVVGHCFPIWLRFNGGKGVATALGVSFALSFWLGLALCALWLLTAVTSRISSLSALVATVLAPVIAALLLGPSVAVAVLAYAAVVIYRHRPNIQRLLAGTEPRIGRGA